MRLLLFDIDGTLLSTAGSGRLALERSLKEIVGESASLGGLSLGGRTDRAIVSSALESHRAIVSSTLEVGSEEQDKEKLLAMIFEAYIRHLPRALDEKRDGFRVLPGVEDLLRYLHSRSDVWCVGLGTGNLRKGAMMKLHAVGLGGFFPDKAMFGGFGGNHALRSDLLRDGVREACQKMQRTSFSEVWIIGDTIHDIRAAKEAGLYVAAVTTGGASREELEKEKPHLLWEDLNEGLLWVQALNSP